ncbi:Phosphate acyltransferase [Trichinella pseudospiralis]
MKRSTNQIHSSCSQTQLRQCHFDAEYCLFENVQLILTNFRIRSRKAPQFKQNKNSEMFLQILLHKTKRKKPKLPYEELDMKIGGGREAERRGKAAANTGPSTNSKGRANSLAEETDEPARGSGSLHLIISITIIRECQHDELEVVAGDGQVKWFSTLSSISFAVFKRQQMRSLRCYRPYKNSIGRHGVGLKLTSRPVWFWKREGVTWKNVEIQPQHLGD